MRLLVLGGTHFVGRAVVDDARARGWDVAIFNRGRTGAPPAGVRQLVGDRQRRADLDVLADGAWDVVIDTWSGAPRAVRDAAEVLAGRAERYVYVSSGSVYASLPLGVREDHETVAGSPDAEADVGYAEAKRGGELAALAAFGERAVLARAGLILGPHEDIGRLPWWLLRMARGGRVPVPGPPGRALQYIDARDLARWLLDAGVGDASGAYNVVSRPGHATTGALLEACRDVTGGAAELVWATPEAVARAGVQPWTELPCWMPEDHEYAGLLAIDVERAHSAGLRCRPMEETVRDTWAWLVDAGAGPAQRDDRPVHGMTAEQEAALLAAAQADGTGSDSGHH